MRTIVQDVELQNAVGARSGGSILAAEPRPVFNTAPFQKGQAVWHSSPSMSALAEHQVAAAFEMTDFLLPA